MAQRAKYKWRGQTYTRKSQRPGKKTVWVKGHCRRKPTSRTERFAKDDLPF
jgi:hypothetical protein